jgi:hypothetical protein
VSDPGPILEYAHPVARSWPAGGLLAIVEVVCAIIALAIILLDVFVSPWLTGGSRLAIVTAVGAAAGIVRLRRKQFNPSRRSVVLVIAVWAALLATPSIVYCLRGFPHPPTPKLHDFDDAM